MTGIIVDGVPYTTAQVRALIRERNRLATELAAVRDTLRRRTAALNRVVSHSEKRAIAGNL